MSSAKLKQRKRRRLRHVRETMEQRQLPVETPESPDRPRSEAERQALIEQRIQEAMADGAFDHLPGKGKPLNLNRNPYLDPGQELAFGLLQNNRLAPEWIERDKEIRRGIEAARKQLHLAWQKYQADPARKAGWRAAVARFEEQLNNLNRKIDDFNLIVPIVSCQRLRLRLADELGRVQET